MDERDERDERVVVKERKKLAFAMDFRLWKEYLLRPIEASILCQLEAKELYHTGKIVYNFLTHVTFESIFILRVAKSWCKKGARNGSQGQINVYISLFHINGLHHEVSFKKLDQVSKRCDGHQCDKLFMETEQLFEIDAKKEES